MKIPSFTPLFATLLLAWVSPVLAQDATPPTLLVDPSSVGDYPNGATIKPTSSFVTAERSTLVESKGWNVKIEPSGEEYPGVHFVPEEGWWDVSAFGHIMATVTNIGDVPLLIALRVDGKDQDGKNVTNTEVKKIEPGQDGTIKVIFGYAYGRKPTDRPDPGAISQVVLFVNKPAGTGVFRVERIEAGGAPDETP